MPAAAAEAQFSHSSPCLPFASGNMASAVAVSAGVIKEFKDMKLHKSSMPGKVKKIQESSALLPE